jgi:acetyl-CoA acyltransferase 2
VALNPSGVDTDYIQHVFFGNVQQTSANAIYLTRHISLCSGLPQAVPALTELFMWIWF